MEKKLTPVEKIESTFSNVFLVTIENIINGEKVTRKEFCIAENLEQVTAQYKNCSHSLKGIEKFNYLSSGMFQSELYKIISLSEQLFKNCETLDNLDDLMLDDENIDVDNMRSDLLHLTNNIELIKKMSNSIYKRLFLNYDLLDKIDQLKQMNNKKVA